MRKGQEITMHFTGFSSSETFTAVPDTFFPELLGAIEDLDELRATLYAIWWIEHQEGPIRFLRREDFGGFAGGVEKAVSRGTLLRVQNEAGEFFFLNSPRGRLNKAAVESGQVDPSKIISSPPLRRSNVFRLYEENIGPLTPLIADRLREAEGEYPPEWFEEAFEIAITKNVRNWKYIEAILKRWKEKGKDGRKNQQDTGKDFGRYREGEFAEYLGSDEEDAG